MCAIVTGPLFPRRNRPVHAMPIERHNRPVIVHLTICTKDRRPILANVEMHLQLRRGWVSATHWLVGRYTVMPDHIHLFCAPASFEAKPLSNWVRFWKSEVCKVIGASEGTLWQTDFWDTQLRERD